MGYHIPLAVQCIYGWSDGDCLASSDDLVLCGESEEDLRVMLEWFADLCRRGLKIYTGKSKVLLNGEKELECDVHIDRIRLEHVLEFKY